MQPSVDPIVATFSHAAARRPERPIVASPRRAWSAGDVERAAAHLAARLAGCCGPGDRVALAAPPGPAFLAGYLAVRRVAAVPVLCDSARPTGDRLAALDRLGTAWWLLTEDGWCGPEQWRIEPRPGVAAAAADPGWGAIKLSSGSTGEPRGIAVRSEALLADEAQLAGTMGLEIGERIVAAVPLAHSYGFSSLVLPALLRDALLLLPEESTARAPLAPLEVARRLEATFFPTVPAYLRGLVRLASFELPSTLRRVIAAGAPLAPEVATAFRARAGLPVQVFYGASECGGITFDREGGAAERGTVGTAVDGVRVAVDVATGRVRVRSAAVAEGYLPEASPELGDSAFLAGDRAEWADGELRLLGRADDLVIVRGRNVQLGEIERVLRDLAGVDDVCVLGVDGPEGPRTLLRAVVACGGRALERGVVLAHCRARLAEHKVPRSLVLVGELPRTERGKLDREALLALAEA